MMPPTKYPTIPTIPAPSRPMPVDEPAPASDDTPAHADYNLLPVGVHSLEHYVKLVEEDKRFHVL